MFLPLPSQGLAALRAYLAEGRPILMTARGSDEGALLVTRYGTPLERPGLWCVVQTVAQRVVSMLTRTRFGAPSRPSSSPRARPSLS